MLRRLTSHPTFAQFGRFFLVGLFNTGVDLVVLNALMLATGRTSGWAYAGFKAVSFTCAATSSYFMNKRFTFGDHERTGNARKYSRFYIISVVGALINVGVASLVVNQVQPAAAGTWVPTFGPTLWGNLGALCGAGTGMFWNFAGYKLIVFRGATDGSAA